MSKAWIVIKEVYRKNVLSWSFFFMVLGPIIMLLVFTGIGFLIAQDQMSSTAGTVALVNADDEVREVILAGDANNAFVLDLTEEEAKSELNEDHIDGYLVIERTEESLSGTYYRKPTSKDINVGSIQQALATFHLNNTAEQMGLNQEQLLQIQSSTVDIDTIILQTSDAGLTTEISSQDPTVLVRQGVAYGVSFIVFMFIMTYVSIISQEIAAEKGSRIMEIILSSISASTHFIGKMVGIGLVILTQLLAYVILFFLARLFIQQLDFFNFLEQFNIGYYLTQSGNVMLLGALYAIIGILIYTSIAGFLGSLVSTTEDVNKMITPIIFTALAGFYIGLYANVSTNNPVVRIGSQIPLFTPFVMPFRIAAETVGSTEIVISFIVSIIFMVICLWVSIIFYKSNVLVYSDKGLINTFKRSFALWKSEREAS
ncbi:ABC transporter permease [Aerococcaceae bacterium DSM 109653]|uniref:ABC transporter permease n=1 Tax=Fundicoccus ignavus TaxID=2664442 RepID=A0A6I2GN69_9LACT|nr:ABC transporter permease [Fundicoccus ignavus]MRI82548.1 ABC transporter permease [Fundicoccus ignavus]MRI84965.1 ABC transporter permease [Fundicoccus ignavus]